VLQQTFDPCNRRLINKQNSRNCTSANQLDLVSNSITSFGMSFGLSATRKSSGSVDKLIQFVVLCAALSIYIFVFHTRVDRANFSPCRVAHINCIKVAADQININFHRERLERKSFPSTDAADFPLIKLKSMAAGEKVSSPRDFALFSRWLGVGGGRT
jgi:hypothetical protein